MELYGVDNDNRGVEKQIEEQPENARDLMVQNTFFSAQSYYHSITNFFNFFIR